MRNPKNRDIFYTNGFHQEHVLILYILQLGLEMNRRHQHDFGKGVHEYIEKLYV